MHNMNITTPFMPFYAILAMGMLLGVRRQDFTRKKVLLLAALSVLILVSNVTVFMQFGHVIYGKFYWLLMQLPVFFGFYIVSEHRGIKLIFTLLTVVTLSAPPVQCAVVLRILTDNNVPVVVLGFGLVCVVMLILVYRVLRPNFNYMLKHGEQKDFWKFCIIPFLYYLYTYIGTSYNFMQYTTLNNFFYRRIPDIMVFVSYVLLVDIFKDTSEKQALESERAVFSAQVAAASRQIELLETAQEQARVYRHDMRHHFSLLHGLLSEGAVDNAEHYLAQAQADIDAITPVRYCENHTVNLIVSAFAAKAATRDIAFIAEVSLPAQLFIPETEVCAVLSNGLENAITAAVSADAAEKKIILNCKINKNNLLVYIENTCNGIVPLKNGLPQCTKDGHGLGTKSIAAIAAKHNGYFACETAQDVFILRVVLPFHQ